MIFPRGRIHREKRQHLKQVVLNHIADGPRFFVKAARVPAPRTFSAMVICTERMWVRFHTGSSNELANRV